MNWRRWLRSDWWFIASFVIPAVIAGGGGIYLAHVIASQHSEIVRLRAQLTECKDGRAPP